MKKKPKIPPNPLVDGRLHRDTLARCCSILDLLSELDSEALMTGRADWGSYHINRPLNDAIEFVNNDLEFKAEKRRQKKLEKKNRTAM